MIENKIYAVDQECQLVRYYNQYPDALLLYLTRFGDAASETNTKSRSQDQELIESNHYFPISYKPHILGWLEECRKEASGSPLVRETIIQYITLIRHLTQQNPSNKMSEEIAHAVIRDKETLIAYYALCDSVNFFKERLMDPLNSSLKEIALEHGMTSESTKIDLAKDAIYFSDELLDQVNLQIGFELEGNKWFFGYVRKKLDFAGPKCDVIEKLSDGFKNAFGDVKAATEYWPIWKWWQEFPAWNQEEVASIRFDQTENTRFLKDVADKILTMKLISRQVLEAV